MLPSEILATVNLGLQCLLEFLKWVQTPDGMKWVNQALADRAKWDSFWADAFGGIKKLFNGDLLK